jgi:branched-chain amino acid transport system substrate-binding protein
MRNRMVKEKRLGIAILAIALAALLVVTACAPRPIVEEKTVQFAWILCLTGPGSVVSQGILLGGGDYVRYFNEQEVVPGIPVERLWGDSQFQYAPFLSHYEKFVERGIPLIGGVEFAPLFGLRERLERDEVVAFELGAGYHELIYPPFGWHYSINPTIGEQLAVVLQYFMENWREERPPRLAFVGVEAQWGYESRYATGYARSLGFEVLPPEIVPIVVLDASVQLLRLKEAGADLVHIQCPASASGPILRDAERLGLLDQFQFTGAATGMGEKVIKMTGVASEGFLIPKRVPWFDETEVPGIKLMLDNMMKYHGKVTKEGEDYAIGWVGAAVVCEAIRIAIENVGYENLDGRAIKEALDGMKDFDVYGIKTITYKPDDHRGSTKMAVYEVRGGEIVRVSDWREAPSGRDWKFE